MPNKLKPCSHCGGEVVENYIFQCSALVCDKCGIVTILPQSGATNEELIMSFNKRYPDNMNRQAMELYAIVTNATLIEKPFWVNDNFTVFVPYEELRKFRNAIKELFEEDYVNSGEPNCKLCNNGVLIYLSNIIPRDVIEWAFPVDDYKFYF